MPMIFLLPGGYFLISGPRIRNNFSIICNLLLLSLPREDPVEPEIEDATFLFFNLLGGYNLFMIFPLNSFIIPTRTRKPRRG